MSKIASVGAAVVVMFASAADAQKRMTIEELMKPHDLKARPDYVPPPPKSQQKPDPEPEEPAPRVLTAAEEETLKSRAQVVVAAQLKDPEAARFRAVVFRGNHVCGMINGKNSYGGYVGYKPFAYSLVTGKVFLAPVTGPGSSVSNLADALMINTQIEKRCSAVAKKIEGGA
jgi:hypothetical protein